MRAKKITDNVITEVNSTELVKGETVLVRAGDIIPNDGEVVKGSSAVDESTIIGESEPVIRESGGERALIFFTMLMFGGIGRTHM